MGKVDPKLLEMAEVFHVPKAARMKYIILPAMMPGLFGRGGQDAGKEADVKDERKEAADDHPAS